MKNGAYAIESTVSTTTVKKLITVSITEISTNLNNTSEQDKENQRSWRCVLLLLCVLQLTNIKLAGMKFATYLELGPPGHVGWSLLSVQCLCYTL
jgi:hypothetical protein